jgi:maltooligosyltrehalose trehalohydrolase
LTTKTRIGATYQGGGRCRFRVWAPRIQRVEIHILKPRNRLVSLHAEDGYHDAVLEDVEPGTHYLYRLDGDKERPDPASRFQPEGVHGASQVIDDGFPWEDQGWGGIPLASYVLYELHVGTFCPQGTFDAVMAHLSDLDSLGITAVELMPIAQFPGVRNWGYDGTYPFAVQNSYGGPWGLKRLVNACHLRGMAVVLDVVYNHLGPEGNYLSEFGPYFTDRYRSAWGAGVNFDGPDSDEVRRFFIENSLYWITEFHADALRLDAVHAILDYSARPFLQDLATAVHEQADRLGRRVYLIAESDLNDTRLLQPREVGGFGLDAQWLNDFHHALHACLTDERTGYYQDFGSLKHLAKAWSEGFVLSGDYSAYRRRRHGVSSRFIPADRFVVFSQNHDQVGNRMRGDRLAGLLTFEEQKLAAGVVLLSPFIPLLFMGQEYGETAPFHYFIDHSDPELVEAVRKGRLLEFASFGWQEPPPDPHSEVTFLRSKLNHGLRHKTRHQILLEFHRELIRVRRRLRPLASLTKEDMEVVEIEEEQILAVRRWKAEEQVFLVFNFSREPASLGLTLPSGVWQRVLDSEDQRWGGRGNVVPGWFRSQGRATFRLHPKAFTVLSRVGEA